MRDRTLILGSASGALGAAGAALLSVLCCIGPAVYAVLGASGALAAARLEPYRPWLIGSSVVFLAFGFWRAYGSQTGAACEDGACRPGVGRGVRAVLWIALAATLLSAIAPMFVDSLVFAGGPQ